MCGSQKFATCLLIFEGHWVTFLSSLMNFFTVNAMIRSAYIASKATEEV